MNEILAHTIGIGVTRDFAHSALPDAPVVDDEHRTSTHAPRHWTATRLRALANRIDPATMPRRPATA